MAKALTASKAQMVVVDSHESTAKANREYHPKTEKPSMAQKWVEFYSFLAKRRELAITAVDDLK